MHLNPKKEVKCVHLCLQIFTGGGKTKKKRKEGSVHIFKSSRRVPWIKYLGRRSLDLPVLAESSGSHWFLTRQLGRHYSKMHYSHQVPSDTLLPTFTGHCVCVYTCMCGWCLYPLWWTQLKVFLLHSPPNRISNLRPVDHWNLKCWQDSSNTHTYTRVSIMCDLQSHTELVADQTQIMIRSWEAAYQYSSTWDSDNDRLRAS